ncbi:MAG TPA: hypothetical protein P5050_05980 [Bacteroidia bacterium]|nr:hypothetical protein [Sphingobacteriales bacterium]HPD65085.1 hypothetical protein [Bacteroidia bacterium]HRS58754.1 hypothetical protein [Bacteroidia bacterium]HRU67912.1 hypothetical protein [Bacteroidia bacterium]
MRNLKILLLITALVLTALMLPAQTLKESRRLIRSYKLTPQQIVEITNKFGKVEVINWEKDSVRIVINFEMTAKTQDKIKKLETLLNFNFSVSEYYVRATTLIGSSGNTIKTEIDNITNAFMTIGAEAVIDYTVYLPSANRLKIKNSFGDIYLGNVRAPLDIDLAHGDLRIADLSSFSNIEIKFGKASIQYMPEGALNCQFSTISLEKAGKLNLISKSSNVNLSEVSTLEIDSRRDVIELKRVGTIKGKLYFTKMMVYRFDDDMNMETSFGSLNLEMIDKMFRGIQLKSNYTDITLFFQPGSSFNFNLTHTDVSFNYPQQMVLNTQLINKDTKQYKTTGVFGDAGESGVKVIINAVKGSVKILYR